VRTGSRTVGLAMYLRWPFPRCSVKGENVDKGEIRSLWLVTAAIRVPASRGDRSPSYGRGGNADCCRLGACRTLLRQGVRAQALTLQSGGTVLNGTSAALTPVAAACAAKAGAHRGGHAAAPASRRPPAKPPGVHSGAWGFSTFSSMCDNAAVDDGAPQFPLASGDIKIDS
jgi:hypothetical protein